MITRYEFRSDNGAGNLRLNLELNTDHMPICFETVYDWAMSYIEPRSWKRWVRWKLVSSEPVPVLRKESE